MKVSVQYLRYVPVLLVMGIIFLMSHQHGASVSLPEIPFVDKLAHGLIYAILAAAAIFAFAVPAENKGIGKQLLGLFVILFCLVYGLSDEFHQSFIPGRFPSGADLAADVAGAVLAVSTWGIWTQLQNNLTPIKNGAK